MTDYEKLAKDIKSLTGENGEVYYPEQGTPSEEDKELLATIDTTAKQLHDLLREYKDKVSTQSTEIDYNPDLKDTDSSPITYMKIREALHVLVPLWKQAPYINLVQVNREFNMQAGTIFPFDVDTILVIPSFTKDQYKVQFTTSTPTPELIKDYQALLHYIKQLETRYEE